MCVCVQGGSGVRQAHRDTQRDTDTPRSDVGLGYITFSLPSNPHTVKTYPLKVPQLLQTAGTTSW